MEEILHLLSRDEGRYIVLLVNIHINEEICLCLREHPYWTIHLALKLLSVTVVLCEHKTSEIVLKLNIYTFVRETI